MATRSTGASSKPPAPTPEAHYCCLELLQDDGSVEGRVQRYREVPSKMAAAVEAYAEPDVIAFVLVMGDLIDGQPTIVSSCAAAELCLGHEAGINYHMERCRANCMVHAFRHMHGYHSASWACLLLSSK